MAYGFTVFTKPWRTPLPELGRFIGGLGFNGIELPVRPGFQVEPENVEKGLPEAARVLADYGVRIQSVAGPTDERTIAACGSLGIRVIRICAGIPGGQQYLEAVSDLQRGWDRMVPALERHSVTLGIQNHCGRDLAGALSVYHAIAGYDPRNVAAVWDPAHCALDGEIPELAIDILWGRICMVNLKNALYRNQNGPEAERARWEIYWTSGRQGLADWAKVASLLVASGWEGNVCLTAEYSDHDSVNRLIGEDLHYARQCFAAALEAGEQS